MASVQVSISPFSSSSDLAAVSYTHLDVYKRQVCTNTSCWGEDLTQISGFEAAVCNYLTQIRENGAYEVMKALA